MDEVINYVMETPGNTNPNVLRGMLENINTSGSTPFWVNFTVNARGGTATSDKTIEEIRAAIDSGLLVCAKAVSENTYHISTNIRFNDGFLEFDFVQNMTSNTISGRISYSNNAWSIAGGIWT